MGTEIKKQIESNMRDTIGKKNQNNYQLNEQRKKWKKK